MNTVRATLNSNLAIDGGSPVRSEPFAPWPFFDQEEIHAAVSVLQSGKVNYWTGQQGRLFEQEFAALVKRRHAIALANGTVALELALYALGIGPGDDVVVPSRTFIATASCLVMRGARPVIADVDRVSGNVTAGTIERSLTPKTRAVIVVHLGGWPCEMDAIRVLCQKRDLMLIEDCAQAHGATYKGQPLGSFGDVAAFSFCQDKILTTGGEGGMLVTDSPTMWELAWSFKDHGKSHEAVYQRQHPPGFRWLHESFGTNWRMTEMQSAIGRVLLHKLPRMVEQRRRNARMLGDQFSQIPGLRVVTPSVECCPSYYKYYVYLREECLRETWNRERIRQAVEAEGIPCFVGSCSEIYLEKAFPEELRPLEPLPIARELGRTSLMFLVHPTLSELDMMDTVRALRKVMATAVR